MTQYTVKDGVRSLTLDGDLIAESSSKSRGKSRWVEFKLYRTPSKTYVISRAGMSDLYHASSCAIVTRNRLSAINDAELPHGYVPCPDCKPDRVDPEGVFPETPRYWAQVCQSARGVLSSLMKYDDNNTEYLTNVARRLLEEASMEDDKIREEYLNDYIS